MRSEFSRLRPLGDFFEEVDIDEYDFSQGNRTFAGLRHDDNLTGKQKRALDRAENPQAQRPSKFHGAFTGGFSAGFKNSVATQEGWDTKTFQSSRSRRAIYGEQRISDYADDEDMAEFGTSLPSHELTAHRDVLQLEGDDIGSHLFWKLGNCSTGSELLYPDDSLFQRQFCRYRRTTANKILNKEETGDETVSSHNTSSDGKTVKGPMIPKEFLQQLRQNDDQQLQIFDQLNAAYLHSYLSFIRQPHRGLAGIGYPVDNSIVALPDENPIERFLNRLGTGDDHMRALPASVLPIQDLTLERGQNHRGGGKLEKYRPESTQASRIYHDEAALRRVGSSTSNRNYTIGKSDVATRFDKHGRLVTSQGVSRGSGGKSTAYEDDDDDDDIVRAMGRQEVYSREVYDEDEESDGGSRHRRDSTADQTTKPSLHELIEERISTIKAKSGSIKGWQRARIIRNIDWSEVARSFMAYTPPNLAEWHREFSRAATRRRQEAKQVADFREEQPGYTQQGDLWQAGGAGLKNTFKADFASRFTPAAVTEGASRSEKSPQSDAQGKQEKREQTIEKGVRRFLCSFVPSKGLCDLLKLRPPVILSSLPELAAHRYDVAVFMRQERGKSISGFKPPNVQVVEPPRRDFAGREPLQAQAAEPVRVSRANVDDILHSIFDASDEHDDA